MDESQLKKIAIIISIIGLILLYYVSTLPLSTIKINELSIEDVGSNVKVCGEIKSISVSNKHIFFTLGDDTDEIEIVIFNSTALHMKESGHNLYEFSQGEEICIPGEINEYPKNSGEIELIYRQGIIERIV